MLSHGCNLHNATAQGSGHVAPVAETKLPRQAHVFEEQRGCPGTEAAESTACRWQEQAADSLEQALLTCPGTFLCSHRMVENLGFPASESVVEMFPRKE